MTSVEQTTSFDIRIFQMQFRHRTPCSFCYVMSNFSSCINKFQKERSVVKFCDILRCSWEFHMIIMSSFPFLAFLFFSSATFESAEISWKRYFHPQRCEETWVILHAVGVFVMEEKWFTPSIPGDEINFTCVSKGATRARVFCYYRHSASLWFSRRITFWLQQLLNLSVMVPFCDEY